MGAETDFDSWVARSVDEVGAEAWDALSGGRPFQSARWYRYGERVMSDCQPFYIILSQDGCAVARATFWLIRNEPLPAAPAVRALVSPALRHWPLFVCRSPISNLSGLILPEVPQREAALQRIVQEACREAREQRSSFLIFDYLGTDQAHGLAWPRGFEALVVPDPGTRLRITWDRFDEYLAGLTQKTRKHYRQHQREARTMGVRISRHEAVGDTQAALELMRVVERRHRAPPNPWWRRLLEEAPQVGAVWLAARIDRRLVGCELILEDNGVLMVTALGLADGVSHIYYLLGYEDIRYAIERGGRALRWGSGTHEVKRRLGFDPEDNSQVVVAGGNWIGRLMVALVRNRSISP
jgi:predicted N-acyltransferase